MTWAFVRKLASRRLRRPARARLLYAMRTRLQCARPEPACFPPTRAAAPIAVRASSARGAPRAASRSIPARAPFARTLRRQWQRIRHSLVALIVHPGQLTAEFRDGQRARSINPWRLAFNVIAVFFVLSFVTDFRAANFPKQDPSGKLAAVLERVDRRFNAIDTVLVTLAIAAAALIAR